MTNKIQINLRLNQETIDRLRAEAEKQKRSMNNMLEVIIEEYLENRQAKNNTVSEKDGFNVTMG